MACEFPEQGAFVRDDGVEFRIWAPRTEALAIDVEGGPTLPMRRGAAGYFTAFAPGLHAGARFGYRFPDGRLRPDPASRLLEGSVHELSTVVDLRFDWTDAGWKGLPLERLVTYELHVGTFTPEGTLDAAAARLPALAELGITAVEPMPLAAFEGERGWGYDGVQPFSVHRAWGGPKALQRFVDAAHAQGLAVILDVVYNHLGPSGNYLREFGPYFTSRYSTPWGEAIDYDGPDSGPVRALVVQNALSWIRDFHADGLRLDAVHGIFDSSPTHLLEQLESEAERLAGQLRRPVHLIAESDLGEPRLIRRREEGGYGLAAQWSDDFHHALHTLLTGERTGYYEDFGRLEDLARAYRDGYVYTGQHSSFRGRPHGRSTAGLPGRRFVVAAQNHDQVGNRAAGDRLSAALPAEALRLAAAATLLSPFLPLIFMGEEYGEKAPFQYFTSFTDEALGRAVSEGRRQEFSGFAWGAEVPDPQDPATFARSKLDWSLATREPHASLRAWYHALLAQRSLLPAMADDRLDEIEVMAQQRVLFVRRPGASDGVLLMLRFEPLEGSVELPDGRWRALLDAWAPSFAAGEARHALGAGPLSGRIAAGPWHSALLVPFA